MSSRQGESETLARRLLDRLRPLLRLLADIAVALAAIAACVAVIRLGVMPLLEASLPLGDAQITFLRRAGVTAALLAGYLAVARFYERRKATELAPAPLAIALGALSGMAMIGLTVASLFALGKYQLQAYRGWSAAWPILVMIVLAVLFEEVIFRGVIFRLLERHAGTVTALAIQAPAFGALHLFNQGTTAVTALSVTLLGAFWALVYVRTRNLWAVVAHHAAWNATIFVSGVPLSGQEEWRAAAPWESAYQGPVWLTGGAFGPEDSLINIVVMTVAVAALAVWIVERGLLMKGARSESRARLAEDRPATRPD